MAKNDIHIAIGTSFSGEGFKQLDGALKRAGSISKQATTSISQAFTALEGAGGAAGKAFGDASKLLGSFASMGAWGVLIAGISSLVNWYSKFKKEADDVALAARGLSREFTTLEAAQAGYQRRVERWRKAHQEALAEEREAQKAADADKKRIEEGVKYLKQQQDAYDKLNDSRRAVSIENMKAGLYSRDEDTRFNAGLEISAAQAESRVQYAQDALKAAERMAATGSVEAKEEVLRRKVELEMTIAQRKNTLLENAEKKRMREEENARKLKEAQDAEAEAAKKKDLEAKIAAAKERIVAAEASHAEKVAALDARIAITKERAAKLEEEAAKARGKSLWDWQKQVRSEAKEKAREEKQQSYWTASAQRELDQLTSLSPKARSDAQKRRITTLRDYIANQDPNNNPELKRLQELENQKDQLQKEQLSELKSMNETLKSLTEA